MTGPAADAAWIDGCVAGGASQWVDNAAGGVHAVDLDGQRIPLVLADDAAATTYVASLVSAWVRYPVFEATRRFKALPHVAAQLAASPLIALLRLAGLHRPAFLGNWMVSTNLHPAASPSAWRAARDAALALAADRPLAIRNVCPGVDRAMTNGLQADGWLLVPARLVYLCDPAHPDLWKHNHVRKDRRLLDDDTFTLAGPEAITDGDLPNLRRHFRDVFFDKHSPLNPDFSDAFFALCRERRFLDLYALRHAGETVGVLGLLERHGWVTTPLIGYDIGKPQSLALYRRLMALLLVECKRRGARLHYSSGAGGFKRVRGGVPALEYTALYVRHLPKRRQAAARWFASLADRYATPVLHRFG